ncbi:thioredoxin family protein [Streptomyces klenkii]|uniref:thioredoxin family protein n=1 Tax=Streptomyces klenkii TaxID=1420899 RepID=UPI003425D917
MSTSGSVKEITSQNFEGSVLRASKPVLVYFYANWNQLCQQLAPAIDEMAQKYENVAIVGKVNIDDDNAIVTRCGVKNIPTIILFKAGAERDRVVGRTSKENIASMIDRAL